MDRRLIQFHWINFSIGFNLNPEILNKGKKIKKKRKKAKGRK